MLDAAFYQREDVVQIAKDLLGKKLITAFGGEITSGIIVETEAYRAPDDKACHAYQNKRTARTETMFAIGGTVYVYICYGIHHLFNVVTGPEDMAHAVLIRAVEPIDGIENMMARRKMDKPKVTMMNGPGKFTVAMGINKIHNNNSLLDPNNPIQITNGVEVSPNQIIDGPRVGMTTCEECAHWPWRFRIKNNKWTSKPDHVSYPW